MAGCFIYLLGPITDEYPNPFYVQSLEEGLLLIENHLVKSLNYRDDMISIYSLPDTSGRAEKVWQFTGILFDEEAAIESLYDEQGYATYTTFPQGHLLNHETSLIDELQVHQYEDWKAMIDQRLHENTSWEDDDIRDVSGKVLDQLFGPDDPKVQVVNVELQKGGFTHE